MGIFHANGTSYQYDLVCIHSHLTIQPNSTYRQHHGILLPIYILLDLRDSMLYCPSRFAVFRLYMLPQGGSCPQHSIVFQGNVEKATFVICFPRSHCSKGIPTNGSNMENPTTPSFRNEPLLLVFIAHTIVSIHSRTCLSSPALLKRNLDPTPIIWWTCH